MVADIKRRLGIVITYNGSEINVAKKFLDGVGKA
jgi:hypothetical protein